MDVARYVKQRTVSLQEMMKVNNIGLAIIAKPEDVFYFSNFNPILNSHPAYVIIPDEGGPCLLVHSIRNAHAREEAALKNIKLYGKWGDNGSIAMNPIDAIKEISGDYSIKGDGVASELDYLSFNTYQSISEKYKVAQIFDISTFINQLKMIKDEYETEMLRKSALLANRGMAVMIECLKNGTNEAEACTQSQFEMRKLWQARYPEYEVAGFGSSEGGIIDALNCWCLSGGRISYGCDCSSNYKPQKGELVLPIVWSKLGGYHVESERTLYVQEADDFKMKVFSAVIQAREKVLSMIKPGITFESMYLEAARIFEENGFTKLMPERIGHGIGLSAHEFPSTKEHNRIKLQKGMVFTVEPGLMSIKWGGVRHSDTVIVSDLGCEILTDTARGILCIN